MAELIWSEDAISDMENIFDYIAQDSPLYARYQEVKIVAVVHGSRLLRETFFVSRE